MIIDPPHLNDIFVVLADVNVLGSCVHRQSQLLLGNCSLDPLAERNLIVHFGQESFKLIFAGKIQFFGSSIEVPLRGQQE